MTRCDLTKEHLQQMTATIVDRYRELELPDAAMPNAGMVRIAYEVVAAHLQQSVLSPLRGQVDDDEAQRKRQAEFDAILAEIKHVAMGNIMPRMHTWDAAKPAHMPKSQAIINRYQKSWSQLAELAGLKMDKRGGASPSEPVTHLNGAFAE